MTTAQHICSDSSFYSVSHAETNNNKLLNPFKWPQTFIAFCFHGIASICFSKKCWPFNKSQNSRPKCLQNTKFPGKAQPSLVQVSAEHTQAGSQRWSSLEQWWRRQPRQDGLRALHSILWNCKSICGKTLKPGIVSFLGLAVRAWTFQTDRSNRTLRNVGQWAAFLAFYFSLHLFACTFSEC